MPTRHASPAHTEPVQGTVSVNGPLCRVGLKAAPPKLSPHDACQQDTLQLPTLQSRVNSRDAPDTVFAGYPAGRISGASLVNSSPCARLD
jgi:hypothetical protein